MINNETVLFKTGPLYLENINAQEDVIINQGGTDSGKTYAIMQVLVYIACFTESPINEPIITVTGSTIPNLKKGAYRVFEEIISQSDIIKSKIINWNRTDRIVTFSTGWVIEFISNQTRQEAKNGKRQYLFANEANGVAWEIFWELAQRTRRKTFLDYNPSEPFWVHEKLVGTNNQTNELGKSIKFIRSWHVHNPFLTEERHRQIESFKGEDFRVYSRGMTGNVSGIIYPNWKMISVNEFPKEGFWGAIDYGYTNDPTTLIKIARIGNNIYLHECCYETALSAKQINDIIHINGFENRQTPIYSEHDPDMISSLRRMGWVILPAQKSIKAGISKVNEYNIFYTDTSKNIHLERSKYKYVPNPITGGATNVPIDKFNHAMDAVRYGVYTHLGVNF